ncbi:zinc induced facilitator 1 [Melia azedarach]|uniref:Zinc induced facilitator 1 n=1 Tax=Melia azedarach TaxID=155640 RepID=A0ACC1Y9N1_MELAZ|nr:zinc induced facilitator 1 [Melia azedarach]
MVGRDLTSVFWGMIADRYGRKPVIIIGTSYHSGYFQHSLWAWRKFLDGLNHQVSSWEFEWHACTNKAPFLSSSAGEVKQIYVSVGATSWSLPLGPVGDSDPLSSSSSLKLKVLSVTLSLFLR